jgi:hypothetical protein
MRVLTHTSLANRNAKIGQYATLGGLLLLVGAFILNLLALNNQQDTTLIIYVFAAFLVGFTLTNIGTVFSNRWARRPHLGLTNALKGLDERYTLYNYRLGAAHVLVGPGGVYVLHPKYQTGPVAFQNNKWAAANARRGLFTRFFAPDPLGNPSAEAGYEVDNLNAFLKKRAPEISVVPQPLIVFMSPTAEISAKESPVPALHVKQLKEHVRRQPKGPTLTAAQLAELEENLGLGDSTTA